MLSPITNPTVARPLWVTVQQARALTNLGTTKIYELIGDGTIKVTKVGKRTLVSYASLESLGQTEAA